MKTRMWKWMPLFFLMSGTVALYGQNDEPEVPGDNFSLEGALELFKKSASPEEFERLLNLPDSKVNNLDLNDDGEIDYIRVIDKNDGSVHAFIMQAVVSQNESQDVAVIELEKLANGKAVLQITGDADIYGTETIIEPTEEVRVNAGTSTAKTVVNVWAWPSVQYVYSPYYTVWVSPWRWAVWPMWWSPWRPVAFYVYHPWWAPYRPYYSACYSHRVVYAHRMYQPMRTTSVIVYNRHHSQLSHYRSRHSYDNSHHRGRYSDNRGRSNGYDRSRYDDSRSDGRRNSSRNPDNNNNSGRVDNWGGRQERGQDRGNESRERFSRNASPSVPSSTEWSPRPNHSWQGGRSDGRSNGSRQPTFNSQGGQNRSVPQFRGTPDGGRSHQPSSGGGGGNSSWSGGRRGRD